MKATELRALLVSLDDGRWPDSMDDLITNMLSLTEQRTRLIHRAGLSDIEVDKIEKSLNTNRIAFASRLTRLLSGEANEKGG